MTKRAKSSFSVHQYPTSHQPWISVDLEGSESGMTEALLGFELKPGTTFQRAGEIAEYLNENLETFTFTKTS
jgi:hypothetical protein